MAGYAGGRVTELWLLSVTTDSKEYDNYQGKPEQIKRRAKRNAARKKMEKAKGKAAIKGKDVDHKNGNPRDNSKKNLRVQSKSTNRSFARTKTARKKG